ncbi:MAG: aspartate kinase [Dehalococcoidia bacterium]
MAIIVQKYGGSSVADVEKIRNVARRAIKAKEKGNEVVVVVSAMGKTTDGLIALARQVTDHPDVREMDVLLSTGELVSSTLLAMTLKSMGHDAVSLSGAQAGIMTDAVYAKARIIDIEAKRIKKELKAGKIVIVAGFQGITSEDDVTTLGRGGSDTTAVALAIALKAEVCETYTDVDGVYTADPRIVPEARKVKEIGYEEMMELASSGAKVLHMRCVELGEMYDMPILVASSFTDAPGSLIHGGMNMETRAKVRGIALDQNVAKVTILGVPDKPGIASAVFDALANANVSVDTIVQNASVERVTDLTFTVAKSDLDEAIRVVEPVVKSIGARGCVADAKLGKVSIIGIGMQNTPGYAARMFHSLYEAGINIELITTSEIRITCIVHEDKAKDAVKALHRVFELDKGNA